MYYETTSTKYTRIYRTYNTKYDLFMYEYIYHVHSCTGSTATYWCLWCSQFKLSFLRYESVLNTSTINTSDTSDRALLKVSLFYTLHGCSTEFSTRHPAAESAAAVTAAAAATATIPTATATRHTSNQSNTPSIRLSIVVRKKQTCAFQSSTTPQNNSRVER